MTSEDAERRAEKLESHPEVANGIGERKAWVRQRSRQGENTLLRSRRALQTAEVEFSCCCRKCAIFSGLHEPPYTEPFVRWCGRTAAVTPPPTRSVVLPKIETERTIAPGRHAAYTPR